MLKTRDGVTHLDPPPCGAAGPAEVVEDQPITCVICWQKEASYMKRAEGVMEVLDERMSLGMSMDEVLHADRVLAGSVMETVREGIRLGLIRVDECSPALRKVLTI